MVLSNTEYLNNNVESHYNNFMVISLVLVKAELLEVPYKTKSANLNFRFYTFYFLYFGCLNFGLQCFDAVGWVAGRASGL